MTEVIYNIKKINNEEQFLSEEFQPTVIYYRTFASKKKAFIGERTNTFEFWSQSSNLMNIKYDNISSLHPKVQFYDNYPVGLPKKIISPEKYLKK